MHFQNYELQSHLVSNEVTISHVLLQLLHHYVTQKLRSSLCTFELLWLGNRGVINGLVAAPQQVADFKSVAMATNVL